LESVCAGNRTVGSNPTLSASWRAPLPASFAGGAGARPHQPINGHCISRYTLGEVRI
jgi:hypothetical protein